MYKIDLAPHVKANTWLKATSQLEQNIKIVQAGKGKEDSIEKKGRREEERVKI